MVWTPIPSKARAGSKQQEELGTGPLSKKQRINYINLKALRRRSSSFFIVSSQQKKNNNSPIKNAIQLLHTAL